MYEPIKFKDLKGLNDFECLTFVGGEFDEEYDRVEWLDHLFHTVNLIKEDKHVIDVRYILGNVLGEEGRHDYLIVFDHPEKPINVMVRMAMSECGIKWTSDFIDNYKRDYKRR